MRPLIARGRGVFRTAAVGFMPEIVQKMPKKGMGKVQEKRSVLLCLKTGEYDCKIGSADR